MKLIVIPVFFFLFSSCLLGQNYTRDAGIRFGSGFVGSYRQFYKENMAIEIFAGYYERGMKFGGMKESFKPALTKYSENFRFYYGYGVHTGFTYTNYHKTFNREYHYDWIFSPVFGMDALVGIDYTFPDVPVLVSADLKPYYEFSLNRIFQVKVLDISFCVKYMF